MLSDDDRVWTLRFYQLAICSDAIFDDDAEGLEDRSPASRLISSFFCFNLKERYCAALAFSALLMVDMVKRVEQGKLVAKSGFPLPGRCTSYDTTRILFCSLVVRTNQTKT